MLDVRYSHLYFYQSLNRLQRGLSAIAELLVQVGYYVLILSDHTLWQISSTGVKYYAKISYVVTMDCENERFSANIM